ncbi:Vomp family autotransporter [Bartonella sp. B23]
MKKLYSKSKVKAVSLGTAVTVLLSSVSPVFAANLAITGQSNLSTNNVNVVYSHGSHGSIVLAGDDDYCGADNVIGRGGKQQQAIGDTSRITAAEQYDRFINNKPFGNYNPYGTTTDKVNWTGDGMTSSNSGYMGATTGGSTNAMPEAYGVYSFATGCGSAATGNYSTAFGAGATAKAGGAQAFGVSALASGIASIAFGIDSEASGQSAIAIGGLATASGKNSIVLGESSKATQDDAIAIGSNTEGNGINSVAIGKITIASGYNSIALGLKSEATQDYAIAIGSKAEAQALGSIAIGGGEPGDNGEERKVIAKGKNSIAIGSHTFAETAHSVAIGINAQVLVTDGVAIGGGSVSRTESKVLGYDPTTNGETTRQDLAWKSTGGAFSVGNTNQNLTRQITNVAAGTNDTDAVNVAQLKALREVMAAEWKISVDGENGSPVQGGDVVDFSVANTGTGQGNLKIEKEIEGNTHKVKFSLSDNLELTSVTTGDAYMDNDGFAINGGPGMFADGIHAGNTKITGVLAGTEDTDAVNVAQLNEVKNQITGNNLVKWDEEQKLITVGNEKDGTKINVANSENNNRVISGIADGKISSDSTDAINGSQLHSMGSQIASILGDSAEYDDDGVLHNPLFSVYHVDKDGIRSKIPYSDIAGAFESLNGVFDDVYSRINNITGDGIVKWDEEQKLITIGAEKGGTKIDITGDAGDRTIAGVKDAVNNNEAVNKGQLDKSIAQISKDALLWNEDEQAFVANRGKEGEKTDYRITHVLNGDINETSTDAINGSQLHSMGSQIAEIFGGGASFESGVFTAPKYRLITINDDGTTGIVTPNNVGKALDVVNKNVFAVDHRITVGFLDIADYFGGGAKYEKGEWQSPTFYVYDGNNSKKSYDNVADAFEGVNNAFTSMNNSITDIYSRIDNITGDSIVKWDEEQKLITIGAEKGGTKIDITGGAGDRIIAGVKDAVNDNEAVNKGQLDKSIAQISQDALLWNEDEQAFVANRGKEGEKTDHKITHILNGDINKDSTDAINGSQLHFMGSQIAEIFGGGVKYEQGKWQNPGFYVTTLNADGTKNENEKFDNVADALSGIGESMVNINNRIDSVIENADNTDALKWNEDEKAYDASHNGVPSKITNVADGNIAQGSKEAVNGGQLWETNERITGVEQDIKHIGDRVDNISATVTDISEIVVNVENKVENIENKVDSLADGVVFYDKDENGKKTNKVTLKGGDEDEPVLLDNVADGLIENGSKEAVNGGQLHDYTQEQMQIILDQSKNYTDQRVNNIVVDAIDDAVERANNYTNIKFEALNYSIENVRKEARQAAAIGLAVSNLRYNDASGKLSLAFGSGLWRSQSAFAFGAGYTSEDGKIRSNLSATTSGGHWGVGVGLNFTLN